MSATYAIGHEEFARFRTDFTAVYDSHREQKPFLRRYTAAGNYVQILKSLVEAYEKSKMFEEADTILTFLIQLQFSPHRHGQWWMR